MSPGRDAAPSLPFAEVGRRQDLGEAGACCIENRLIGLDDLFVPIHRVAPMHALRPRPANHLVVEDGEADAAVGGALLLGQLVELGMVSNRGGKGEVAARHRGRHVPQPCRRPLVPSAKEPRGRCRRPEGRTQRCYGGAQRGRVDNFLVPCQRQAPPHHVLAEPHGEDFLARKVDVREGLAAVPDGMLALRL